MKARGQAVARYWKNREKIIERQKTYYQRNREKIRQYRQTDRYKVLTKKYNDKRRLAIREWTLKNNFGIGLAEYDQLLKKQNYKCAICNNNSSIKLDVDHCHNTNKVRGLLCRKCNTAIGLFQEDAQLLKKAAQYLEH